MKLTESIRTGRPTMSFEVFPPKTETTLEDVLSTTRKIAELRPAFVSVTYGAGGGTSKYTRAVAEHMYRTTGVPTLAHLTCISSTRQTVAERIADMRAHGIENVMALRGDLTQEMKENGPGERDYHYAVELVRELKACGDFCIGGACYPEVHPESADSREDIRHLKEKVDAGCDFLTTQMFFDNSLYYSFLYRVREAGVTVPIFPGIMPITSATQIKRAIELSGSFMPHRFLALVDRFGSDPEAMKQAGIAYATDQIIDLYANGVQNVHVYTMNKPDVAAKIMDNVSAILK